MDNDDDDPEQYLEERVHFLTNEQVSKLKKVFSDANEEAMRAIREGRVELIKLKE